MFQEYNPITFTGTGTRFTEYTSQACAMALDRALQLYNVQPHWDIIRKNAMAQNNAISLAAQKYVEVFSWALHAVQVR